MKTSIVLSDSEDEALNNLSIHWGVKKLTVIRMLILKEAISVNVNNDDFKAKLRKRLCGLKIDSVKQNITDDARRAFFVTNANKTIASMVREGVATAEICAVAREIIESIMDFSREFKERNKENLVILGNYSDPTVINEWKNNYIEVKRMGLYKDIGRILVANKTQRENNLYVMREIAGVIKKIEKKE